MQGSPKPFFRGLLRYWSGCLLSALWTGAVAALAEIAVKYLMPFMGYAVYVAFVPVLLVVFISLRSLWKLFRPDTPTGLDLRK
jgi:hypothetical protein